MSWTPDVTVWLDRGELPADDLLDRITIRRGRDGVDVQPRAGIVTAKLYDDDATLERAALDRKLSVAVDGVQLVTDADVSDSTAALAGYHADHDTAVAVHTLTATGKLARMHRRGGVADRPVELDGERVAAILEASTTLTWAHAPSHPETAGSWAEVPGTWAEVEPTPLEVDVGTYALDQLDDGGDPWKAVQQAANDGLGVLAELRDGGLRYTDAHGRTARVVADGFLDLPRDAIVAPGLDVGASIGDLANTVRVKWTGGEVVAVDDDAVAARGGVLEHTVDTQLANEVDAIARADRLLRLRKVDVSNVEQLEVRLDALDPTLRARLLALEVGTPVRVGALPVALGGRFTGVVEGLTWTITRHTAALVLDVSAWALSEYAIEWRMLAAGDTWAATDPTITWNTAQELI